MVRPILRSKSKTEITDLTVVIPVYNEDPDVVVKAYTDVLAMGCKAIVVDDGDSVELPDWVNKISHYPNMGYGYALKKGIAKATTDLVCTMDGDGQHNAEDVIKLYKVYRMVKDCKMVVGMRWDVKESRLRHMGRKAINFFASCLCGHYLVDLNSGLRVMDRKLVMAYEPILCDVFSFTTSLTMSMVTDGHKMVWLPIEVNPRVKGTSHVKVWYHGAITLWLILKIGLAMRTRTLRGWIRKLRRQD